MNKIGQIIFTLLGICLGGVLVFFGISYYFQLSLMSKQQEEMLSEPAKNVFPKVEDQESPLEI